MLICAPPYVQPKQHERQTGARGGPRRILETRRLNVNSFARRTRRAGGASGSNVTEATRVLLSSMKLGAPPSILPEHEAHEPQLGMSCVGRLKTRISERNPRMKPTNSSV